MCPLCVSVYLAPFTAQYGDEALFAGAMDPECREVLWPTQYAVTEQVQWVSLLVQYRKHVAAWGQRMLYSTGDDTFLAFTRGSSFVALTNVASSTTTRDLSAAQHPFQAGDTICNVFWADGPKADCLTIGSDWKWQLSLMNGEPKIYDLKVTVMAFYEQMRASQYEWMRQLDARMKEEQPVKAASPRVALE